ncbi:unnamed protein product [Paramecium sonneborni]|uniref:Uncharacterized protein n=1 Tax=Paramecium sonneborni TaxID=65129 RepID=A0A8S1QTB4_9CILI|nr:unnamed protein product [Paramecium sonneborni]
MKSTRIFGVTNLKRQRNEEKKMRKQMNLQKLQENQRYFGLKHV